MARLRWSQVAGATTLFAGGMALGRLSQVDRQVSRYRRTWEDHNLSTLGLLEANPDCFVMVALGDSATQGVGAEAIEEGYAPRVAAAISAQTGRQVALVNLSISGATLETMLTHQLPALAALPALENPDLTVVTIGGNDVGVTSITPELFRDYAARVTAQLPAGTLLANIPSFGVLKAEARAAVLSDILDDEGRAAGHHPVDLRTLSQSYETMSYTFRYHAADMFHPNSRAYGEWAELFLATAKRAQGLATAQLDPDSAPRWIMRSGREDFTASQNLAQEELR